MYVKLKKVHGEDRIPCTGKNISLVSRKTYAENEQQHSHQLCRRNPVTAQTNEV